jgi:ABC-type transport system involved in multi-copper enzyme maturation permease subunit
MAIARTSVLEALREKVLYGLVVFGIGMVLLSIVLSNITLGHRIRVVTDLSMTGLLASGMLLAVILGANAIARDIDRRVALPILAKPVSRTEYVLGRFVGILAVVALNFALMVAFATVVIALNAPDAGFPYGWAAYSATVSLIFLRIALMTALAVTLSGFVSTTVAQVAALGLAVAGHFTSELKFFLSKDQGPMGQALAEAIYRTVPDLGALDSLYELIHGQPIATAHLALCAAYAVCYAGAALTLGCWVFSRRELS